MLKKIFIILCIAVALNASETNIVEKVEAQRLSLLELSDKIKHNTKIDIESYNSEVYKKIMVGVRNSYKKHINFYFDKMIKAVKGGSTEHIGEFGLYMKEEQNSLNSLWSSIKLLFHSILSKVLYFFVGYNSSSEYIADHIGKLLAAITISNPSSLYEKLHTEVNSSISRDLRLHTEVKE